MLSRGRSHSLTTCLSLSTCRALRHLLARTYRVRAAKHCRRSCGRRRASRRNYSTFWRKEHAAREKTAIGCCHYLRDICGTGMSRHTCQRPPMTLWDNAYLSPILPLNSLLAYDEQAGRRRDMQLVSVWNSVCGQGKPCHPFRKTSSSSNPANRYLLNKHIVQRARRRAENRQRLTTQW